MTPAEHTTTTRVIENGWRGNQPLPVTEFPGGKAIALLLTKEEARRLLRGGFISLVLMDDGSVSARVGVLEVETEH